ncbi:MAG: hypothetical protein ACO1TE_11800 [Prosthecobacter sp.]
MTTWPPFLCLLAVLSLAGFAQANPAEVLKRECAQRLQSQYGLTLDPAQLSLEAFTEIEARLAVCFRLKSKLRQFYDYRTTSLAFLQDLEYRWDTCERIQKNYNILLRHEYYTAPALADLEKRLDVASRIYQTYGRDVNWRDSSLQQLQTTETQLAAAQAPLTTPPTQALASSAVVFRSKTPTPPLPPREPGSYASASTYASGSHAYQPASSTSYASPSYTPSTQAKTSRRVTSAPVFYDDGSSYRSWYHNRGYRTYSSCTPSYRTPSVPCVPSMPSIPSIPCMPLLRIY